MKILSTDNSLVDHVKDEIQGSVGKSIEIKEYNRQRRLLHTYVGEIKSVYDSLFLVECQVDEYKLNRSFTYVDVAIGDFEYLWLNK